MVCIQCESHNFRASDDDTHTQHADETAHMNEFRRSFLQQQLSYFSEAVPLTDFIPRLTDQNVQSILDGVLQVVLQHKQLILASGGHTLDNLGQKLDEYMLQALAWCGLLQYVPPPQQHQSHPNAGSGSGRV